MATVRSLQVNVRADISEFQRAMQRAQRSMKDVGKKLTSIGKGLTLGVTTPLVLLGKKSIDLANDQIAVEKKLETVVKQRTDATEAEIQSIKDLTAVQQKLGVIGDEVQLAGAQQIATFSTTTSTIKTLIPAMNNLLAQQKGVNATQSDAVNIANMVGKALQGQLGSLSRVGITFSEVEGEMLKHGNEQERAAVLAKIITQNVGEMNKALAETDQGAIQQLKNAFGDLQEEIGKTLLPILKTLLEKYIKPLIERFSGLSESTKANIVKVAGLAAVIGPLVIVLGSVITAVGGLIGILGAVSAPVIAVITVVGLLIGKIIHLLATNEEFRTKFLKIWEQVKVIFSQTIDFISVLARQVFIDLKSFWDKWGTDIIAAFTFIGSSIQNIFTGAINVLIGLFKILQGVFQGDWGKLWEGVKQTFGGIWEAMKLPFKAFINFVIQGLNSIINGLNKIKFKTPDWIPGIGGKSFGVNISNIPMLAKGGIVNQPTLSMIGEAGPEAVIPLDKMDKMGGGITINVTGNTFSNRRDIDIIGDQLVKKLRMSGVV